MRRARRRRGVGHPVPARHTSPGPSTLGPASWQLAAGRQHGGSAHIAASIKQIERPQHDNATTRSSSEGSSEGPPAPRPALGRTSRRRACAAPPDAPPTGTCAKAAGSQGRAGIKRHAPLLICRAPCSAALAGLASAAAWPRCKLFGCTSAVAGTHSTMNVPSSLSCRQVRSSTTSRGAHSLGTVGQVCACRGS